MADEDFGGHGASDGEEVGWVLLGGQGEFGFLAEAGGALFFGQEVLVL